MELQANIIQDDCKCIITNDEPIITLAKERRESWCSLLRQRVSGHSLWLVLTTGYVLFSHLMWTVVLNRILMWLLILITGKNVKRKAISPRVRWVYPAGESGRSRVGPHTLTQLILGMWLLWKWVIQVKPLWISFLLDLSVLVWGGIDSYRFKHTSL